MSGGREAGEGMLGGPWGLGAGAARWYPRVCRAPGAEGSSGEKEEGISIRESADA